MKNFSAKVMLRALFVLVAVVTLSGTALSSGSVSFKPLTEDGKVLVSLEDVQADVVNLTIEDKYEDVVYYSSKVSGDELYKKVYDMSNLPDGTYVLTAMFGKVEVKEEFVVNDSEVKKLEKEDSKITCQPVFRLKDNALVVLYQCPTNNDVKVTFASENEVFFDHESGQSKLAAKYDLSSLPNGDYEVVLNTGGESFKYDVRVE